MGLYLRQLLAGREFAREEAFAQQMANFVYVVGDDETKQCMIVDPAWDPAGIIEYLDREGMSLTGVLVTHYHPDHVGGDIFGHTIKGLAELVALRSVKAHVNEKEFAGVKLVTGLGDGDLVKHWAGDVIEIGSVRVHLLHTPGHTPGSQCFLAGSSLISGDTLFIGGCGRVDLPGGNPQEMYYSLTQVLAKLPDETLVYPGHNYAAERVSTIGKEKMENIYMNKGWLLLGAGSKYSDSISEK
jgi:glyoxylase-like metal-dependent hydrolase (beta-lactamase superfamily II)